MAYEPETYWDGVAARISARGEDGLLAGDGGPFYRYKRRMFLALLAGIDFGGKTVLEIGPGPGGNLAVVAAQNPKELHGADLSETMLQIAAKTLRGKAVHLQKMEDAKLRYADAYFNISFTATVLQHTTDEQTLRALVKEICRVTRDDVYIFERIEKTIKGTPLCLGRPVVYYQHLFDEERFQLRQTTFLHTGVSHFLCGVIRKVFNRRARLEGERESRVAEFLQRLVLPFSSRLDNVFTAERELAMLHFSRREV